MSYCIVINKKNPDYDRFEFLAYARSQEQGRYNLDLIMIRDDYGVATDGRRLHKIKLQGTEGQNYEGGLYRFYKCQKTILLVKYEKNGRFPKFDDLLNLKDLIIHQYPFDYSDIDAYLPAWLSYLTGKAFRPNQFWGLNRYIQRNHIFDFSAYSSPQKDGYVNISDDAGLLTMIVMPMGNNLMEIKQEKDLLHV